MHGVTGIENGLGKTVLQGQVIQLEPLTIAHQDALKVAADYEEIWEYMPWKATAEHFDQWFIDALNKMHTKEQTTYAVRRKTDQALLGATAYYDIQPEHKRLTLGYSWYRPEVWGSIVNTDVKLLMLEQAFEVFMFNRVEIGTDSRNLRSYYAIKKLGAREEGLLRQHMILHDQVITDTILFSILRSEWPTIKKHLKYRLQATDTARFLIE